jgi:hypothetical protein
VLQVVALQSLLHTKLLLLLDRSAWMLCQAPDKVSLHSLLLLLQAFWMLS